MVYYANPVKVGIELVSYIGDGTTINLKWHKAYANNINNSIAYHIYYSTEQDEVFCEAPNYVVIDGSLEANIVNLDPGQTYFFAVRPVEYNDTFYDLENTLPIAYDNLRIYPTSVLRQNMSTTDLIVPLLDVSSFPSTGVVRVGGELIEYLAIDSINDNLVVYGGTSPTSASLVDQDGYFYKARTSNVGDGYLVNLTLETNEAISQRWDIECLGINNDGYKYFIAIGTVSGQIFDGYGSPILWLDGYNNTNGILSFSIYENPAQPFVSGDVFEVLVDGYSIGGEDGGRGYNLTTINAHYTDGYDGYVYWSPNVSLFTVGETDKFDRVFMQQPKFEYPNFAYTEDDGYKQTVKDLLNEDFSVAEEYNENLPPYDYAGYHRTDPVALLNGECIGSYIGGEQGCIDAYGNFNILRGLSIQERSNQRLEVLLSITGEPVVLIKRVHTGIICSCYDAAREYPDDRCPLCYGTKYVFGYEQYYNPRKSDGRILVRVSPSDEFVKMQEAGFESENNIDLWTLPAPVIKTRDILVFFDQDDNETFRYEVGPVTRNATVNEGGNNGNILSGAQKLKAYRIRKTDPAYQIRVFRNTEMFPTNLSTSIASAANNSILPHSHTIVINENTATLADINQTTAVSQGHNHPIINGIVQTVLGHTHNIILP